MDSYNRHFIVIWNDSCSYFICRNCPTQQLHYNNYAFPAYTWNLSQTWCEEFQHHLEESCIACFHTAAEDVWPFVVLASLPAPTHQTIITNISADYTSKMNSVIHVSTVWAKMLMHVRTAPWTIHGRWLNKLKQLTKVNQHSITQN